MTRKQITYTILSILFFGIAFFFEKDQLENIRLQKYATILENSLELKNKNVLSLLDESEFILRQLDFQGSTQENNNEKDLAKLLKLTNAGFTIVARDSENVVFWSNNKTPFEKFDFTSADQSKANFAQLENGYYLVEKREVEIDKLDQLDFWSFIPIKYAYRLNSEHLKSNYNADQFIPANTILDQHSGQIAISYKDSESIAFISSAEEIKDKSNIRMLGLLYLMAFIFLGMLINIYGRQLSEKYSLGIGAAFLIITILGLKTLSSIFHFTARFSELSLFSRDFVNFTLSASLGDFIINVILMLWIILFFHRNIDQYRFSHLKTPLKHVLGFLNASVISLSIVNIANVNRGLILDSNIQFDFENILNLNNEGFLAMFGVILLSFGLFLFSHLLMLIIMRLELPRTNRQLIYVGTTLIALSMLAAFDLNLDIVRFLLFILSYQVLFDIFVHNRLNNLAWLVIWIVIMAIFSSSMIYKFNEDKDIELRKHYAKELANPEDQVARGLLEELYHFLEVEKSVRTLDRSEVYNLTYNFFRENTYLYNNYSFQIDKAAGQLSTGQIQHSENDTGSYNYNFDFSASDSLDLGLKFSMELREQSKVYTELMQSKPFKDLAKLSQYDYAIYRNFKNVYKTAKYYGDQLNAESIEIAPDNYDIKEADMHSEVIYYGAKGNCVFISKKIDGWIKPVSLFSYLFGLLIILILVLGFLNLMLSFIPKSLSFAVIRKPSLKNRIQLSVISIIIISFITIGLVTVIFFRNSHVKYHENRLQRKTKSVIRDMKHELDLHIKSDSIKSAESAYLDKLDLAAISNIHRLDINLFDKGGRLIKTSENDFFNQGIISSQMSPAAFHALSKMKNEDFVQENEMLGQLSYKTAFIPLNLKEKTLAYIGLPYYSQNSRTRSDATSFMGTLLNVYVFLLLIAGVIAIAVANSITRPISVIGQKLNQFRLGGKNEKLEWKSKDELGALIKEYNKMVATVGKSAELLAQSEREGAWREMAKQVAHEIKNPLTPMKLSIQYLMHAFKGGADNVEELMTRVSNTLIQQIDNLTQIANEFSNFAKMPRAENQKLPINNVVESVFDLFSEVEEVELKLLKPDHELWVYADKNHLVSVFNNIIKNAIQAIPEDREGFVTVELYEKDNSATVRLSDNGIGITDEMKEKVFVPNFTTKSSGTGLGLAISKNIIESVNGKIWFETEVGKGTQFYVTLPIIDVLEPEAVEIEQA